VKAFTRAAENTAGFIFSEKLVCTRLSGSVDLVVIYVLSYEFTHSRMNTSSYICKGINIFSPRNT